MTGSRIQSKVWIILRGAIACLLASSIAAIISLALQDWFGVGDLDAFYYWTTPFTVLTAIIALALNKFTTRRRPLIRYLICGFIGLVLGYVWTMFVAYSLGQWFYAFSFPVGLCWMAGGFLGLGSAPGFTKPSRV
jgi:hypothetical protein